MEPAIGRESILLALLLLALFATVSVVYEWMEVHCRHIHRARVYYGILTVAGFAVVSTLIPLDGVAIGRAQGEMPHLVFILRRGVDHEARRACDGLNGRRARHS